MQPNRLRLCVTNRDVIAVRTCTQENTFINGLTFVGTVADGIPFAQSENYDERGATACVGDEFSDPSLLDKFPTSLVKLLRSFTHDGVYTANTVVATNPYMLPPNRANDVNFWAKIAATKPIVAQWLAQYSETMPSFMQFTNDPFPYNQAGAAAFQAANPPPTTTSAAAGVWAPPTSSSASSSTSVPASPATSNVVVSAVQPNQMDVIMNQLLKMTQRLEKLETTRNSPQQAREHACTSLMW